MDSKRLILIFALLAGLARAEDRSAQRQDKMGSNEFSLGVHATSIYTYPMAEYQRLIINHLAVGVLGFFMESNSGGSTTRIKGGVGTLNFYALDGFRGLWVRSGFGVYYFETHFGADHENFRKNGWLATIGARGKWEGGVNIGLSAGALLIQPFTSTLVDFTLPGTMPIVTFDLGVNF